MTLLLRRRPLRLPALSALSMAVGAALANPVGPQVVHGNVQVHNAPGTVTVNQASQRAIVNWQSFSIQAGEATRFNLPSASSAILNRVVTASPSAIHGTLSSNGQVFLVNPSGIVVGPGGIINVGSLVASTRDVSNAEFLAGGALKFNGTASAPVVNLGTITARDGDAVLLGARVENAGTVDAPQGVAAFVAANQVYYAPDAASRVVVLSGVAPGATATGVDNAGTIRAAQVELRSVGGNPYALAVNSTGLVSATRVDTVGGRVLLSADVGKAHVGGPVSARAGATGGAIDVFGHEVTLAGAAVLDASGADGGGTIRVGGDFQGRNAAVRNAALTTVASGARLVADATVQGDGGQVIVWADGTTTYQGSLSARGGAGGGNGGSAEVSGKAILDYRGTADLRAPAGQTGNLLLDPNNITIGVGGTTLYGPTNSYLELATLEAQLATANVTVTTSIAGLGSGDITIAPSMANHTVGAVHSLTLVADRDIIVNGPMLVFAPFSAPLVPPTLTMLAGRHLTIAPNLNPLGMGGFAVAGEGGLTLASAQAVPWGTMTIGANSNLGTIFELTGGLGGPGGPIRVFAPASDTTTLTGWTAAASKPTTVGKGFGDAGTAASGTYYKGTFTQGEVVVITSASDVQSTGVVIVQNGPTGMLVNIPNTASEANPFVSGTTQYFTDLMIGQVAASGYTSWFGPEVDALLLAAGLQLPAFGPAETAQSPATQAILAYVTTLANKSPRTAAEQKIYDYVSNAILKMKVTGLPLKLEGVQKTLDAANARIATLQAQLKAVEEKFDNSNTGMTVLFSGGGEGAVGMNGLLSTKDGDLDQMNILHAAIADQQAIAAKATQEKTALLQQGVVNTNLTQLSSADAGAALARYFNFILLGSMLNARSD